MEELKSARDYLIYAHNCLIKVIPNSDEVKELQDKTSNLIDSLDNVIIELHVKSDVLQRILHEPDYHEKYETDEFTKYKQR